jgi:hypothetical protein
LSPPSAMADPPGSPGSKVPSIDEHLDAAGFGMFQIRILCILSMLVIADGMEMTMLSMLRKPFMEEFGLDDYGFAALGCGVSPLQNNPFVLSPSRALCFFASLPVCVPCSWCLLVCQTC